MAGVGFKNRIAFAYLQECRKMFRSKYTKEDIAYAKDYDMSASFSDTFKSLIVHIFIYRTRTILQTTPIQKTVSKNN